MSRDKAPPSEYAIAMQALMRLMKYAQRKGDQGLAARADAALSVLLGNPSSLVDLTDVGKRDHKVRTITGLGAKDDPHVRTIAGIGPKGPVTRKRKTR
jgi:hypothetical protein